MVPVITTLPPGMLAVLLYSALCFRNSSFLARVVATGHTRRRGLRGGNGGCWRCGGVGDAEGAPGGVGDAEGASGGDGVRVVRGWG